MPEPFLYSRTGAPKCYKVSEITQLVKNLIEREFSQVAVEGEVSNFKPSSSGHYYFSLKDNDAVITCVMFKNRIDHLTFTPRDGMLVKTTGSISVYAKRGNYQLICETLAIAGTGDILAMLEERKKRLAKEGLFDSARKRKLPLFPERVAVVTSPTGAAIRDIIQVLTRRNSINNLVILPTQVQGDDAARMIAEQIRIANLHEMADVIIVGRGGGSLEDLLPFSDEAVVRAIAESKIPVISAVGHEVDVTLSDLAADVRAPTPSAAAEIVAAPREELLRRVMDKSAVMRSTLDHTIERIKVLLSRFAPGYIERSFRVYVQPILQRFDDLKEAMLYRMQDSVKEHMHRLEILTNNITAHSPLSILEKGYAVVTSSKTGEVIKSSKQVFAGDIIRIRLHKGKLISEIKEKITDEEL
jgi:exodeoxyribonuclease VII large subunit